MDEVKANGVHYTPPELAEFLAEAVAERLSVARDELKILDPACGAGSLLFALYQALPFPLRKRVVLCGYETDGEALRQAEKLLSEGTTAEVILEQRDFLEIRGIDVDSCGGQRSLFDHVDPAVLRQFDAVIANPPYVRTQVLGSAAAQELARRFGLTGRVDLYHAFTKAMANVLKSGGVLGLLTSNRFLTVKSGASLRHLLRTEFDLEAIFDLGDTKLFNAAVLPVIVVGRKQRASGASCKFHRIYEYRPNGKADLPVQRRGSILEALGDHKVQGLVSTKKGTFNIERGVLQTTGDDQDAWSLSTADYRAWLSQVDSRRSYWFQDVATIRVGIKTTADEVFIREDWGSLPAGMQPEAELLRPLITHHETERWIPASPRRKVLYPHIVENGERIAVRLKDYPRAAAYLESHKTRLSQRRYLIESGRKWHEIWVPQNPNDWARPKIVSPDICESSRFCFDSSGAVINGDCYWITLRPGFELDWLFLLLAVANSSFVTRYYDIAFHNKLYSGRRRFMTQYLKKFPLPRLDTPLARRIVQNVNELLSDKVRDQRRETEIDRLVWESFGLVEEAGR